MVKLIVKKHNGNNGNNNGNNKSNNNGNYNNIVTAAITYHLFSTITIISSNIINISIPVKKVRNAINFVSCIQPSLIFHSVTENHRQPQEGCAVTFRSFDAYSPR